MGGAEKELFMLLKRLPKNEFECHCLFDANGPLVEKISSLGVKIHIVDLRWWVARDEGPEMCLFNVFDRLSERTEKIAGIIKANKIDLVMTNTIVVADGAIAARIAGVPHIWRTAEMLSSDPSLKSPLPLKTLYSTVLKLSDYVVGCANAVMKEFENSLCYKPDNMKLIYSAMERSEEPLDFTSNIKRKNIVFSAGYISPRKGFTTLLKAAKLVSSAVPDVRFKVAGGVSDNEYYRQLLKERKRLKLEKVFELCGFRNDIDRLMRESAMFVLPSLSEPFGIVLLEAMAAAKPTIATDSGGPSEAIVDGVSGYIVPVDDHKKMADKIIFLLTNKDVAEKMGRAGFERAKKVFDVNVFADSYAELFKIAVSEQREEITSKGFQLRDIIEIFNSIGKGRKFIRDRINFYNKIHSSFLYRVYRKMMNIGNGVR